jgi:predicted DsbA family dithiol-disulfide isomerase
MKTIHNPNRNGQPRKSAATKKGYKITIKISMPEYYALKAKAREAGINRSEYLRQCFAHSEVKQRLLPEHLELIRQLSGMANNLNQLAHRANTYGYSDVYRYNTELADEIDKLIKRIAYDG